MAIPTRCAALVAAVIYAGVAFAIQENNHFTTTRWTPSRTYHVENYKLSLHFSELQGEVFGDELVTIRPFEANFGTFCLNSTELTIDSVKLVTTATADENLVHKADDHCLWISLGHRFGPADLLSIRIVYHGHPRIGLFFVNPSRNDPNTPREIYTQGEPEFNHYWFPCWDYPNDMATSETITTVPEGQVVVSNGKLKSVKHEGDQVTYDWVESVPHSSYLVSLAIGPWKKFSDNYGGIPVDYYVTADTDDAVAKRTFHLTPDMMGFFSRATGVEYPYEKYDQVAVHDFIFGGQENVSATTLTDTTLHDARADVDYPSTVLVAHELGQHWFGDYVQGRDWANIWLNEGFATYMTALYTQYHEGNDAYRFEIYNDQNTALEVEATGNHRPIVDRHYLDPLDMLEEITHEKGASVLDMMRYVVDGKAAMERPASQSEPLFQALNYYLVSHHAQAADTGDLLSSIWTKTGQDLTWFFYEWLFDGGHPDYKVTASYDHERKMEVVKIAQTQTIDANTPVFDMPIELVFFGENDQEIEKVIRDDVADQEFDIPMSFDPSWVDFDPDDVIYKTVSFEKKTEELIKQAQHDPHMMSRLWATRQLGERLKTDSDCCLLALTNIVNSDTFYGVRMEAVSSLGASKSEQAKQTLLSAMNQSDSRVRTAAINATSNFLSESSVIDALTKLMQSDQSYAVEGAAAKQLGRSGSASAFNVLQSKLNVNNEWHVTVALLNGLSSTKNPKAAQILLAYSQPGVPKRVRMNALSDLPMLKKDLERSNSHALSKTVESALDESYLPLHRVAEHLVDVFRLKNSLDRPSSVMRRAQ